MLDAVSQSALCKTTALSCVTFSLQWNYRKEEVKTAKRTLYLTCFFIIKSMHMPRYETSKFLPLKSQTVRQTQHHLNKRCTFELHPSDPHGKPKTFQNRWSVPIGSGLQFKGGLWLAAFVLCKHPNVSLFALFFFRKDMWIKLIP